MKTATPAKLRSGAWGARVTDTVERGEPIQIVTRSGKTWTTTVQAVIWEGAGVTLVATSSASSSSRSGRSRGTWTGCSCGSVEEYERSSDCASCTYDRY